MNASELLRQAGLTPTASRLRVLAALQAAPAPLSARALWEGLRAPPRIGFATVYRALSALCEAGLARKLLSDHNALFETAQDAGAPQLVCSRCGKTEQIDDPHMLRYNADVLSARGLDHANALTLYADCKRKECADK